MAIGEVAGLKSRELVMAGILGGGCRDKMADRLLAVPCNAMHE